MRGIVTIWKYQAVLLLRNRLMLAGLVFLFAAGLFSAGYGKHFVEQQQKMIYSVDTLQERKDLRAAAAAKANDTLQMTATELARFHAVGKYYQASAASGKTAVYRPAPFTSLAIGQKDNFPFFQDVSAFSWENVYNATPTDIQNPVKLLAGNFDLAFVIVYLFPLFIIAIGYNALSGEKETSTYTLLRIQGSIRRFLRYKLLFQALVVILLSVAINFSAFAMNGIWLRADMGEVVSWLLITIIYIAFWFSIVYFVVFLNQSSSTNALVLGSLWIAFLLLVPSIIHKNVADPQGKELAQTMFNSRGDFPGARDLDSAALADSFHRMQHPYPLPAMKDTGRSAGYFYSSLMKKEIQVRFDNSLGRQVVAKQAKEYEHAVQLSWLNPVFAVQNAFNQLGNSEINNYHAFLASAEEYQTKLRYHLNRHSILGKPFLEADLLAVPAFNYKYSAVGPVAAVKMLIPVMGLMLLLLCGAALWRLPE